MVHKFCITFKNSWSNPISTMVSKNKKNMPENAAFLIPIIALHKRGRALNQQHHQEHLKERKRSNK